MISQATRIAAITRLGTTLKSEAFQPTLEEWAYRAHSSNNWFTPENVLEAISAISNQLLDTETLNRWTSEYPEAKESKKIGVVMAGNIPAVGFHDALCVLISGHQLLAKLSTDDTFLMKSLLSLLIELEPAFASHIHFVERLNDADAYIATGSDNTARYFEHYFSKKPNIIRRNRVSVGLLTGNESTSDLVALGKDILTYYGLGCRNVSKVYVPEGYDFTTFYESIEPQRNYCVHHHKFFNNYEYNRSILLVNRTEHLDNGFLMLLQSDALVSPLSVLHYQTYKSREEVERSLNEYAEKIQCVVSNESLSLPTVPFGQAQNPTLTDYADGIDTMSFLSKLN
jgi:hypothetical protein